MKIILSIATLLLSSSAYAGHIYVTDHPNTKGVKRIADREKVEYQTFSQDPKEDFFLNSIDVEKELAKGKNVSIEKGSIEVSSIVLFQPLKWDSKASLSLSDAKKIDIQNNIKAPKSTLYFTADEVRLPDLNEFSHERIFINCSKLIINNKEADQEAINNLRGKEILVFDRSGTKQRWK